MEKRIRQSSLPSSLIPYLYSRPQYGDSSPTTTFATTLPLPGSSGHEVAGFSERSKLPSMRTSVALPPLPSIDNPRGPYYLNHNTRQPHSTDPHPIYRAGDPEDAPKFTSLSLPSHLPGQRYGSPIYSDPNCHASWPALTSYYDQYQSRIEQPSAPQDTGLPRGSWQEGEAGPSSYIRTSYETGGSRGRRGSSQPIQGARLETYNFRGDTSDTEVNRGAESYAGSIGQSSTLSRPFHPPWSESYQNARSHSLDYQQFPLTMVNVSHGWTPTGGDHVSGSVSDASSDGRVDNDDGGDETYNGVQKGKKRRRDSDVGDDSKKNRNIRKTAVACNFCRGRKLRCDGVKPSCFNCTIRKSECEYVPVQRRRGPGKAKGLKSKKGPTTMTTMTTERKDPLSPELGSGLMSESTKSGGERPPSRRTRGRHSPAGWSDTEKGY